MIDEIGDTGRTDSCYDSEKRLFQVLYVCAVPASVAKLAINQLEAQAHCTETSVVDEQRGRERSLQEA